MKGFIAKLMATSSVAAGSLVAAAGCAGWQEQWHDVVDPCYPQRYMFSSRQLVKAHFAPQVQNGHILDQTVWNYHFEPGTAILTPGGMEHLAYLARRRPCPDTNIYLQVAQDIPYDPSRYAEFIEARNNLDSKRTQAVQDFLNAETTGRNLVFNVVRHDPPEDGMSAVPQAVSLRLQQLAAQGVLVRPAVGGGAAAAGAAPH
jgi:hypothetical protein